MINLILNVMLLFALMGALYMGLVLHKKFTVLQKSKEEFMPLIHELQQTTLHAESYLESVKKNIQKNAEWLQQNIQQSEALRDELGFLIERGNRASQDLEEKITQSRLIQTPSVPEILNLTPDPSMADAPVVDLSIADDINHSSFESQIEKKLREELKHLFPHVKL